MGNSASSLPYSIGKQVSSVSDGWALHEGSRKSDNASVSVFVGKKPALIKSSLLQPALHHFVNSKKLRHPHILQVWATLDTDHPTQEMNAAPQQQQQPQAATGDLIIVTEPCILLDTWLSSSHDPPPPPEQVAWGLEAVVRALHFMHSSAQLAHGNLAPSSFYVTPAGDVKLWNFALVTSDTDLTYFRQYEAALTPMAYRSPERQEGRWDAVQTGGIHAMDSYGLGVLIDHLFDGHIPAALQKAVQRLQTPNIRMRPRLQPLLKCPIFDTPYQKLQLQLEEFTVQPVEQKIGFWQNLTPSMQAGLIPEKLSVYKLLPMIKSSIETICQSDTLKTQDLYRREVASMLPPMFYIAENYLDDRIGAELTNTITILFNVNDRGVRGALLQKIHILSQHLSKNALNNAVFEPMCSGFSDSSPALRELTLKANLILIPSLTHPSLEKLSRYLVRLQSDPEPGIRTNTVMVFSQLAPHLTETSRQKLLLPAFIRSMKDPFPPCRLAALKCTLKAKDFFDPHGVAAKVLPAVTPQLLDTTAEVRREAFIVVDDLLFYLRQESERMNALPEPAAVGTASAPGSPLVTSSTTSSPAVTHAPAPASGGYLSGLSSWMTSSAKAPSPQPAPKGRVAVAPAPRTAPAAPPMMASPQALTMPSLATGMAAVDDFEDDDGWGDDDADLDMSAGNVMAPPPRPAAPVASATTGGRALFGAAADEDDFFGGLGTKQARPAAMQRPKGKLALPVKKAAGATLPKPAVTKLQVKDDVDDGWDDF